MYSFQCHRQNRDIYYFSTSTSWPLGRRINVPHSSGSASTGMSTYKDTKLTRRHSAWYLRYRSTCYTHGRLRMTYCIERNKYYMYTLEILQVAESATKDPISRPTPLCPAGYLRSGVPPYDRTCSCTVPSVSPMERRRCEEKMSKSESRDCPRKPAQ